MNSEIVILDPTKCMSIQNSKSGKYNQCRHRRKEGEYCKKHAHSKHLLRIDDSLKTKNISYKYEELRTLLIEDEELYTKCRDVDTTPRIPNNIDEQ